MSAQYQEIDTTSSDEPGDYIYQYGNRQFKTHAELTEYVNELLDMERDRMRDNLIEGVTL